MRPLTVTGLTADGTRLVLRSGNELFELPLSEVPQGRQPALPFAPTDTPPTVREIQQRIRCGESAQQIAEVSGLPLEHVARYEGPVLAEREFQAQNAQRARVDGRLVGELVAEHMVRMAQDPDHLVWDAWLREPGRWEVRAQAGREVVRLRWDPAARRVQAVDEPARQALRLGPIAEDALGAVLRPLSTPSPVRPAADRPSAGRAAAPAAPAAAPGPWPDLDVPGWAVAAPPQRDERPPATPEPAAQEVRPAGPAEPDVVAQQPAAHEVPAMEPAAQEVRAQEPASQQPAAPAPAAVPAGPPARRPRPADTPLPLGDLPRWDEPTATGVPAAAVPAVSVPAAGVPAAAVEQEDDQPALEQAGTPDQAGTVDRAGTLDQPSALEEPSAPDRPGTTDEPGTLNEPAADDPPAAPGGAAPRPGPGRPRPGGRKRAPVPQWDDIAAGVSGRGRERR